MGTSASLKKKMGSVRFHDSRALTLSARREAYLEKMGTRPDRNFFKKKRSQHDRAAAAAAWVGSKNAAQRTFQERPPAAHWRRARFPDVFVRRADQKRDAAGADVSATVRGADAHAHADKRTKHGARHMGHFLWERVKLAVCHATHAPNESIDRWRGGEKSVNAVSLHALAAGRVPGTFGRRCVHTQSSPAR